MSGKQIHLQVPPKLFGVNSWIPQTIRQWLLVRRQKTHGSQSYYGKLAVDDIWQIADTGDQELGRLAHSS